MVASRECLAEARRGVVSRPVDQSRRADDIRPTPGLPLIGRCRTGASGGSADAGHRCAARGRRPRAERHRLRCGGLRAARGLRGMDGLLRVRTGGAPGGRPARAAGRRRRVRDGPYRRGPGTARRPARPGRRRGRVRARLRRARPGWRRRRRPALARGRRGLLRWVRGPRARPALDGARLRAARAGPDGGVAAHRRDPGRAHLRRHARGGRIRVPRPEPPSVPGPARRLRGAGSRRGAGLRARRRRPGGGRSDRGRPDRGGVRAAARGLARRLARRRPTAVARRRPR